MNNSKPTSEKEESKQESWLKKDSMDLKKDYSQIDYSKYLKLINPIKDSLKMNNKYPLIKDFPQKYSKDEIIPEEINLKILLKDYITKLSLLEKYASENLKFLKPKKYNFSVTFFYYEGENNYYLEEINESLFGFMGNKFKNLRDRVKLHENLFFYILTILEEDIIKNKFVDFDINILYWVSLFHDIGKHQKLHKVLEKDYIYGILDKMHPFKSILLFIETLLEKNLFKISDEEMVILKDKFKNFKKIIFDSYEVLPTTPSIMKTGDEKIDNQKIYNISLKHFDKICEFLKYIKNLGSENQWIYDAAVLIVFHQNIPNNEHNMNHPLLTNDQIKEVFDLRLIEMMRVIMYLDSSTYTIFDNTEWEIQINKQIDILRNIF
jgi:hypothetical protein